MPEETNAKTAVLPAQVITPSDVGRLLKELARLSEILTQYEIKGVRPDIKVADITPLLHEYLKLNNLDILRDSDRREATNKLNQVLSKSPTLHFSFSSDPSAEFRAKLSSWLRSNIDSSCLIVVGLVPDIGAGCYVRTTNKVFDLTLKTRLKQNKQKLIDRIKGQSAGAIPVKP